MLDVDLLPLGISVFCITEPGGPPVRAGTRNEDVTIKAEPAHEAVQRLELCDPFPALKLLHY